MIISESYNVSESMQQNMRLLTLLVLPKTAKSLVAAWLYW